MKDKETLFREKADRYLCCFNAGCPRSSQCLHFEVGRYMAPAKTVATCISPVYQHATDGQCGLFRDNQPVTMPVGMKTRFYQDMPYRTQRAIKDALIDYNCRTTYYKYHNDELPITPDYLAVIHDACRRAGWDQPLHFDGEIIDYLW